MTYNTACQSFPSSVIANSFSFRESEFLDIGDEARREAPEVSFG